MIHTVEAIYAQGVLKPVGKLRLPERQRVRLTVEPIHGAEPGDRTAALKRLRSGIERMRFNSQGALPPSRDELHDRA